MDLEISAVPHFKQESLQSQESFQTQTNDGLSRNRSFSTDTVDVDRCTDQTGETDDVEKTPEFETGVFFGPASSTDDETTKAIDGRASNRISRFGGGGRGPQQNLEKYAIDDSAQSARQDNSRLERLSSFFRIYGSPPHGRRASRFTDANAVHSGSDHDDGAGGKEPEAGHGQSRTPVHPVEFSIVEDSNIERHGRPEDKTIRDSGMQYPAKRRRLDNHDGDGQQESVRHVSHSGGPNLLEDDGLFGKYAAELHHRYMGSNTVYLSDICIPEGRAEFAQLYAEFEVGLRQCEQNTREQFRIVSEHGDHVHVVHACPYSNSTCRCTWLRRSAVWRSRRRTRFRRRVFVADLKVVDWENIARYFATEGHAVQNCQGPCYDGRLRVRTQNVQEGGHTQSIMNSKCIEDVAQTRAMTASTVAKSFIKHFVCIYGIPDTIITDQGTNFMSKLFTNVCKLLKIQKVHTTIYHPQANSVERWHRYLKNYLRCYINKDQSDWNDYLSFALFTYNVIPHSSTNYVPYEIVFGRPPNVPTSFSQPLRPIYNYDSYLCKLRHKMQLANEIARQN
ncbi:uncharacterized protein LOC126847599 [Adelges cooleyi]|uniref:uncharacterized protein LOC126847599 n=1 Tax=Adelges cooleyi TaxID=133065 RepID=UPI002180088C|nr:uncharacterized protein LOC126847599 [Adelges cooleyi]